MDTGTLTNIIVSYNAYIFKKYRLVDITLLNHIKHIMAKEPAFLKIQGKIMVAGDTHGDLIISKEIVKKFFDERFDYLVFLGDYIDRAPPDIGSSLPNINFLLDMKVSYPKKLFC